MPGSNDLWSFARSFYAEPGVAEACLSLQDEAGADVCVVLHLLHLATAGRTVSAARIAELDTAARPWREAVIIPLRRVRRRLRPPPIGYVEAEALRKSLAALEIEAERMQLTFLERLLPDHRSRTPGSLDDGSARSPQQAAQTNLAAYRDLLHQPPETMVRMLAIFEEYMTRRPSDETSG